jgi:predicted nucleic-acid-binding protein
MWMDRHFVDTNVFLRFLTNDVPVQAHAVEQLLMRTEKGELHLHTSSLAMAEIVWTLESYYELSPEEVRDHVIAILNTPGLFVEHAQVIARAIMLYADENIDFVDAYNGVWMQAQDLTSAITFDTKHFQRIPGIAAHTPVDLNQES